MNFKQYDLVGFKDSDKNYYGFVSEHTDKSYTVVWQNSDGTIEYIQKETTIPPIFLVDEM